MIFVILALRLLIPIIILTTIYYAIIIHGNTAQYYTIQTAATGGYSHPRIIIVLTYT